MKATTGEEGGNKIASKEENEFIECEIIKGNDGDYDATIETVEEQQKRQDWGQELSVVQ